MKRLRKTFTVVVMALVVALMAVFSAACGDEPGKGPKPNGGDDVTYTFTLLRSGGTPFGNTRVNAYAPGSGLYSGRTNNQGVWSFTAPKGTYTLNFEVPDGFQQTGTIDDKNNNKTFTLKGALITDPMPDGTALSLGDCMYDFSFVDSTGKAGSLSEILQTKKAVMLNFWFANCGPCVSEFPGLQNAYAAYKDDIEIIAISRDENSMAAEAFRKNTTGSYGQWDELTFRVVGADQSCSATFHSTFNVYGLGWPTSIMIDREGVICFIESGATSEDQFRLEFDRYTAPDGDYEQLVQFPNTNTQEKPDVQAPTAAKIAATVNGAGFTATYYQEPNEYNWPWIISEDGESIKASNSGKLASYSILYAEFEAEANSVFAFDYKTSTEAYNDMFYVYIDGEIMQTYSGIAEDFKTCYAYVPLKTGKYTLALAYVKDEQKNVGDDTVYVKNLRLTDTVGERTEVFYRCATGGMNDNGDYNDYITPVYNEDDGYYHVGTKTGPLVLADILSPGVKWETSAWSFVEGGNFIYDFDGDGEEEDRAARFGQLVAVSSLSYRKGVLGVTQELKNYLVALTDLYGNHTVNNKEWLDLCYYTAVYGGADGEIAADPAEGLAAHNAFQTTITERGAEPVLNHVDKDRVLMPRGLWYEIKPEETAVYDIYSVGDIDTIAWLYDENSEKICENDRDENPANDRGENFAITRVLEKGKTYYVAVDFNNIDWTGQFNFVVEKMAADGTLFTPAAAGGLYEYIYDDKDQVIGFRVADAVDYVLDDDGYYRVGTKDGPMLYINMLTTTGIFTSHSFEQILSGEVYYCKICGSMYPSSVKYFEDSADGETVCYCGNNDKSKYEKKATFMLPDPMRDPKGDIMTFSVFFDGGEDQMLEQVIPMYYLNGYPNISTFDEYATYLETNGIEFIDYTDVMRGYVADSKDPTKVAKDAREIGGNNGDPYIGYIPASKELVDIIQKYIIFGDYSISPTLENTWLMTAYYFMPLS